MLIDQDMEGDNEAEGGATVVTLECAEVLPNAEAKAVVQHIESVWDCGRMQYQNLTLSSN